MPGSTPFFTAPAELSAAGQDAPAVVLQQQADEAQRRDPPGAVGAEA
jgi:hypothetical protein